MAIFIPVIKSSTNILLCLWIPSNTDQIKKLLVDSFADFLFSNSLCLLQRRRIKTCGGGGGGSKLKKQQSMEFISTNKGGGQLIRDGYIYQKNKNLANGNTYWECQRRRNKNGCIVKLVLGPGDGFLCQTGEHNHFAHPEENAATKVRTNINKKQLRETNEITINVITANVIAQEDAVLAKLPRLDSIRRDVRRQCIVHQRHPPLPGDLLIQIPEHYNLSSRGNQFILYDNGRQDRLIIFGITESIGFIENSHDWFMDGTFSVAPPGFAQLYTFHILRNGRNLVGIYALLVNKRIDTYVELLTEVQRLTNDLFS